MWRMRLAVARVWGGRWWWRKRGGAGGNEPGLILDLSNSIRMLVEISEQNSFLVVRSTKDFVIVQIELVTHTKPDKIAQWLTLHWIETVNIKYKIKLRARVHIPVAALLTRKALQVVNIGPGSHHHLEGGDHFVTSRAVARGAKQPCQISWRKLSDNIGVSSLTWGNPACRAGGSPWCTDCGPPPPAWRRSSRTWGSPRARTCPGPGSGEWLLW